jgi:tetratricopeptide (TPR) repeat protein
MSYTHRQEIAETQKNAQLYLRLGRFDAAEKLLKATLSELGSVSNVHNLLGLTYYKQSKFAEAIVEFNRALSANPEFVEAGLNLAATLCDVSRYEDAAAIFAQLQARITHRKKLPPLILGRIANLHVESGRAYEDCSMYSDAVQEYRRALSLFDRMSDVRLRLSRLYVKLGQMDKAHRELEQLIKLDPENSEAHTLLGLIYFKLQKLDFAKVHWREAQKIDPFDSASRGLLALVGESPAPTSEKGLQAQSG